MSCGSIGLHSQVSAWCFFFFSLFDVGTLRFVYLESEVLGVNIAVLLTYLIMPYLTNKDGLAVMSSLGTMIFLASVQLRNCQSRLTSREADVCLQLDLIRPRKSHDRHKMERRFH